MPAVTRMEKVSLTKDGFRDLEAGDTLYPGISSADNAMRWGFIQKIYGIVGAQLVLTAAVGSFFAFVPEVKAFAMGNSIFSIFAMVAPFITLIPLFIYRYSHPLNLGLLALWTASLSVTVGLACSMYKGIIVVEALALTAVVVLSLTAYTFYAVRKGADFGFMGPMLFAGLLTLILWGFVQVFLAPGPVGQFVYSLVGAGIFSMYIVYDTDSIIKRHSYDEYVWASVELYLDIINLFLRLLEILRQIQGNN